MAGLSSRPAVMPIARAAFCKLTTTASVTPWGRGSPPRRATTTAAPMPSPLSRITAGPACTRKDGSFSPSRTSTARIISASRMEARRPTRRSSAFAVWGARRRIAIPTPVGTIVIRQILSIVRPIGRRSALSAPRNSCSTGLVRAGMVSTPRVLLRAVRVSARATSPLA